MLGLKLLLLASSATLASCSARHELPAPLAVDLPTVCEEVLQEPEIPPARGPEGDAIAAYRENRETAKVAVATIVAGRNCVRDQRQLYAGKGNE